MLFRPRIIFLPGGPYEASAAGFNARHTPFSINIHRDIRYMPAVLAQELYEWRFLRKIGLLMSLPFALAAAVAGALGHWPLAIGILIWAGAAAFVGPYLRIPGMRQRMELAGHMVEIRAVARLSGPDNYLEREARRTVGYEWFKGWTLQQVIAGFLKHGNRADRWLDKHWPAVLKLAARAHG